MTEVRRRRRGELPTSGERSELDVRAETPQPGEHDPTLRPPEDMYYAMSLLESIARDAADVSVTTVYGDPHSKGRPLIVNGRAMPNTADVKAEAGTRAALSRRHETYTGNVAMVCLFFRPNKQRIDVDNMLKHVCDAANGLLWTDDSQVTSLLGVVELDAGLPRTVIATAPQRTTMLRGSDDVVLCPCGTLFSRTTSKYCSLDCPARARGFLRRPVPCEHCGDDFIRNTSTQRYCSPDCRIEGRRGRMRGRGKPFSQCSACGTRLTHKRGGRCRECWRADPAPASPLKE